jgi:hypothetical protein
MYNNHPNVMNSVLCLFLSIKFALGEIMRLKKYFFLVLMLLMIVEAGDKVEYLGGEELSPIDLDVEPTSVKGHPRIESKLGQIISDIAKEGGISGGLRVIIEMTEYSEENLENIKKNGANVERVHDNLVQIRANPDKIMKLADLEFIQQIRTPLKPFTHVSEGVNLMGADLLHENDFTGSGVKVAVLDLGFRDYTQLQAIGELPSNLITQSG